jgi:hypothetical protein
MNLFFIRGTASISKNPTLSKKYNKLSKWTAYLHNSRKAEVNKSIIYLQRFIAEDTTVLIMEYPY